MDRVIIFTGPFHIFLSKILGKLIFKYFKEGYLHSSLVKIVGKVSNRSIFYKELFFFLRKR